MRSNCGGSLVNQVWTDQRWNPVDHLCLQGAAWKINSVPSTWLFLANNIPSQLTVSRVLKGEFLQIWLSARYFARGVIFINISFVGCEYFVEASTEKQKSATLEFPHNPENSLRKESRQTQPFLHQVFQTLQFDTDASLPMDKVPVWVLMQETRMWALSLYEPILHRGSVFSLQFVKLKIWGVVAKYVSEPFDCWFLTYWSSGQSDAADSSSTTSASDHEWLFAFQAQKYATFCNTTTHFVKQH